MIEVVGVVVAAVTTPDGVMVGFWLVFTVIVFVVSILLQLNRLDITFH